MNNKKIEEKLNRFLKRLKKEENKKDSSRMDLLLAEKLKEKGYEEAAESIEKSHRLNKKRRNTGNSGRADSFLAGVHIMLKSFTYSLTFFATVAIVVAIAVPVYLHYYAPNSEKAEWLSFLFPNEESADPFENGFPDENGSNIEIRNEIALSLTADKSQKTGGYIVPKLNNIVTLDVGNVTEEDIKKYVEVNETDNYEVRTTDEKGIVELVLPSESDEDVGLDTVNDNKGYEIKIKRGLELSSGETVDEEVNLIIPVKPDFEIVGLPYFTPADSKSLKYVSDSEVENVLVIEFSHADFDTLLAAESISVKKVVDTSVVEVDNLTVYKEGKYLKFVSQKEWDAESKYVVNIEDTLCDNYDDCIISQGSFEVDASYDADSPPEAVFDQFNFVETDKEKYLSDEKVKVNVDTESLVEIGEIQESTDIVRGQLKVYRYISEIEQGELIFSKIIFPDQDGYRYNFAPSSSMTSGNETEFLIIVTLFDEEGENYTASNYIQVYRSPTDFYMDYQSSAGDVDKYYLEMIDVINNVVVESPDYELDVKIFLLDFKTLERDGVTWKVVLKKMNINNDHEIVKFNKETGIVTVNKNQLSEKSEYGLLVKWDCHTISEGEEECVESEYEMPYKESFGMFDETMY